MVEFTRASRDFDFVPGSGSSVEIWRYHPTTRARLPGVVIDIEQGFVRETFRNKNTTHSGSNGADLYTRVGAGWTFALVLSLPARLDLVTVAQVVDGGALAEPFVQSILGPMDGVAIQFNIGDPLFWSSQGLPERSMRAAKAKLETVETRLDSTGVDVVGLNVAGIGSSLLWTYLEENGSATPLHPGVWF